MFMDNRVKKLILGYDLCNDYIQISCYNQKTQDMDTICYIGEKMMDRIPTVLCRLNDEPTRWLCGYDAWKAVNEQKGILVENFVEVMESESEISVGGHGYSGAELTRIFIAETLNLLTKYYPHWEVGYLVISVEKLKKNTIEALRPLSEVLGIEPSLIKVVNHVSAYEHYALNQKKELWQYDVGLFDYTKRGMTYYHLTISKKRMPATAMATSISLQEYFDGSEIGVTAPPELDRRFLEVVRKVTANKIISTVYLTGEGFEGNWAKVSLKNLCHHRKGFIGSNIFSRGACYFAMAEAGLLPENDFVALNEDVISKSIYILGSKSREFVNEELIKAGQVWYDAQAETNIIPDGMDHMTLHIMDYVSKRECSIPISLSGVMNDVNRPDKTYCLNVRLSFDDFSTCRVRIFDKGFGEFYSATEQTYEQTFNIYDETLNDKEVHEPGRLILTNPRYNTVPYHFGLSGIRVYSLEELCYYIYHHVYAVSKDTFGDDLIYWVDKNLGEKALAKRLREGKKNQRSLKEMVRMVHMSVDYYTKDEIQSLQKIIEEIELQNPVETKKVEADNYLRYGKLMEALSTYKKVELMMEEHEDAVTKEFRGNVYHNMAVTFARLANGEAALACFKKAFEFNGSDRSRDSWLMLLKIMGRDEELMNETNRMILAPEIVELYHQQLKEAEDIAKERPVFEMLDCIKLILSEEQWDAMESEVTSWIEAEKGEYRR